MHEQREQREHVRRIEAIIQSKFLLDEDNIQSLLHNVPTVKQDPVETNSMMNNQQIDLPGVNSDEIQLKFSGYRTMPVGGVAAHADSSDEEEDEDEHTKTPSVNWIQ